jgi:predicted kinase
VLVILSGLPGTGKTAVARELARIMPAFHLRIDSIEAPMFEAGWNVDGVGYAIAQAIAEDNLRLAASVIADCVNPWPLTRAAWRDVAHRAGARWLEVEIVCSDREEHRRRVEIRSPDLTAGRIVTWADVLERDYRPWDRERLVVDTAAVSALDAARMISDRTRTA